ATRSRSLLVVLGRTDCRGVRSWPAVSDHVVCAAPTGAGQNDAGLCGRTMTAFSARGESCCSFLLVERCETIGIVKN
ncbi:hypothetical protein ACT2E5_30545, partial [Burkholderia vietnamiensis]|uniref:hypothetical protein n=1 Tax=Burkholderia vietnamiensis TaxID=60552 RepID=UPI00402AFBF5